MVYDITGTRLDVYRHCIAPGVYVAVTDVNAIPDYLNMCLDQLQALTAIVTAPETIESESPEVIGGLTWLQALLVDRIKALTPLLYPDRKADALREIDDAA